MRNLCRLWKAGKAVHRCGHKARTISHCLEKIQLNAEIYTFTALGSKGFLFAPLCSEVLAAQVLGEACPLTSYWVNKLNPRRFIKKSETEKALLSKTKPKLRLENEKNKNPPLDKEGLSGFISSH